eukprot:1089765-Lingulodinium_polyedra.AAC.1
MACMTCSASRQPQKQRKTATATERGALARAKKSTAGVCTRRNAATHPGAETLDPTAGPTSRPHSFRR